MVSSLEPSVTTLLAANPGTAANTVWVVVAAVLVMFMQAGFAMLEVGFSRMKNVSAVVGKVMTNFGVASLAYWAVGFGIAFGATAPWLFTFLGGSGFFPTFSPGSVMNLPAMSGSDVPAAAKFMFQFVFCAVSLAIVWGTMLERTKFIVYPLFAIPFAAIIYPLISHQLFGGGWLQATVGAQDFAGSTVVHLTGATAGFAGLLLLGSRIGKYDRPRRPNVIPGHNAPLAQLGVLILWFGWFGFNPGSTLQAMNLHFADVVVTTQLAAAAGALAGLIGVYVTNRTLDVGMIGNGAIAALVAITAPSGYVEPWAAIVIGAVAGVIVSIAIPLVDRVLDDPVGCLSAHGLAGIWGTLSCGLFTVPALAQFNGVGHGGLFYTGSFQQLGAQAVAVGSSFATVFVLSFAAFWAIDRVVGLRVSPEEELEGLDVSEHGMWGYPEAFMPVPGGVYRPRGTPTVNPSEQAERVRMPKAGEEAESA
ncbi:MAG: ammonium transporter [Candidatus Dormibacteraeota bacterium]|nr:ammonium transporter [Candidatus Dormibacteraeota bacterium]MBO0704843.1 ammonium transporter [Candidatus Dormibacteraeota bacterium]MBO0761760.1 ammonium transporter [Candidatus Dormibacteraeota bacterium]